MRLALAVIGVLAAPAVIAEVVVVTPQPVTEWKAVHGRIEARDRVAARARLGGTLAELTVAEGDLVQQGQVLARIVDDKLALQRTAVEAQKAAAQAQLANAQAELTRGEELLRQGVTTAQRLDALRTQVDVLTGQIAALEAQAQVLLQSQQEGLVLAPAAGRVLDVPVSSGGVVMPGETVATLGTGGVFLRLSVPERHAASLHEGDTLQIEGAIEGVTGRLARVYPLIEAGRVTADVEVTGLPDRFIDARVLVRLPMGQRPALLVPATAIATRGGLDFVAVQGQGLRVVVPGQAHPVDGVAMVEILSGLVAGDAVETVAPQAGGAAHD